MADPVETFLSRLTRGGQTPQVCLVHGDLVLAEPAAIVAGEPDRVTGLRRLYVCLTRAVTSLVVVHGTDLPVELAA